MLIPTDTVVDLTVRLDISYGYRTKENSEVAYAHGSQMKANAVLHHGSQHIKGTCLA